MGLTRPAYPLVPSSPMSDYVSNDATEMDVDDRILAALAGAATMLEEATNGPDGERMVLKAVVVFQYIDAEGDLVWGYRRVKADWFDVGGAATFLDQAGLTAWLDQRGESPN